jgi:hypothetical protein
MGKLTPAERSARAKKATNTAWANTTDRTQRTAKMRAAGPPDIGWHAKRLGFDPDNLTDAQRLQAQSGKKAYYADLRFKQLKKQRLRREAGTAARNAPESGVHR